MDLSNAMEFSTLLVQRGMGMLGREKMVEICDKSNFLLLDDDTLDFKGSDVDNSIKSLIVNFSSRNLIAKMTATSLANKYNIPIPDEIKSKRKKKSRLKRLLRR